MTLPEMEAFMSAHHQPRYRADQLFNWIYKRGARSFHEMSNFSKALRSQLDEIGVIGHLTIETVRTSYDGSTRKFLFRLSDEQFVEGVYMEDSNRRTVCLSSQVGCALQCDFCATGRMGFIRNLSAGEIVDQLLSIHHFLNIEATNIVFMGMGEPFSNYAQVIKACHLLSHDKGIAIGKRKITVSTSGIVPAIRRFADEQEKFKLAISLNAPNDHLRSSLMPINDRYSIGELMNAARYYAKRSRHRVTFEYVLMAGVNNAPEHARQLQALIKDFPCKLNIIPYNGHDKYHAPTDDQLESFIKPFLGENIVVSIRRSKGADIDAACGQLYHRVVNNTGDTNTYT